MIHDDQFFLQVVMIQLEQTAIYIFLSPYIDSCGPATGTSEQYTELQV